MPGRRERAGWLVVALFLLHALPWLVRPALLGGDEPHFALAAHSLAADGDLELADDYDEVERGGLAAGRKAAGKRLYRHLVEIEGRLVFSHPLGLPLLAAPLLRAQQAVSPGSSPDLLLGVLGLAVSFAGLLAGWDLLALTLADRRQALLLACALHFTTPLWFYGRTFYTEPYTCAFALLALHLLARRRWWLGSVPLAYLPVLKEVTLLIVVPVLAFVLRRAGWRAAARAAAAPAAVVALLAARNQLLYGTPWVGYQPFATGDPVAGLAGLLASPSHGLLVFAPVTALAAAGWLAAAGERPDPARAALVVVALYLAVTAAWADPAGGSSYGSRLLLPTIPAFALPLARVWRRWRGRAPMRWTLLGLGVAGFTLQWCAATEPFHAFWGIDAASLLAAEPLRAAAGALLGGALGAALWRAARRPAGAAPPVAAAGLRP